MPKLGQVVVFFRGTGFSTGRSSTTPEGADPLSASDHRCLYDRDATDFTASARRMTHTVLAGAIIGTQ